MFHTTVSSLTITARCRSCTQRYLARTSRSCYHGQGTLFTIQLPLARLEGAVVFGAPEASHIPAADVLTGV
jgi:hypothetical protein